MRKLIVQRGLSLTELVVALALSMIILATMGQLFLTSRSQIQTQEATARIQENARQALQYLSDDVRMAGFMGAVYQYWLVEESSDTQSSLPNVTNECFTSPFRWSAPFIRPTTGNYSRIAPRLYGQNAGYSWFNGCIQSSNFVAANDVLSMHYAGAPWIDASGAIQTSAIPDTTIGDNDEMFYMRGNTVGAVVFTCGKGSGAGAVGTGGGTTCINRSTSPSSIIRASEPLSTDLSGAMNPAGGETANYGLESVVYYVRPCTNAGSDGVCGVGDDTNPALVRARMEYNTARCPSVFGGGGGGSGGGSSSGGGLATGQPCVVHEVVAEGVASFQLEYGVDTTPSDSNDGVDRYLSANQISSTMSAPSDFAAWSNVRNVRVWLLVRSTVREPGYVATNTDTVDGSGNPAFDVGGTVVTPTNGYRYQLFTSTMSLRNRWRSF